MISCKLRFAYGRFSAAAFALAILVSQSSHAATVLHYSFDDAGDMAANSAGDDGTINEGPLPATAGVFGGAADFTPTNFANVVGAGPWIQANGLSDADFPTGNATVAAWVRDNTSGTNDGWINFGSGSNSHSTWGAGNDGYFNAFRDNNRVDNVQFEPFDPTEWNHLAIVNDKDSNEYIVYFNGVPARVTTPTAGFNLGAQRVGRNQTDNRYDGSMDEFWMFDQALTAEEVNSLMNTNSINPIPEPSSLVLALIASLGGLALRRRRRRN